LSNLIKSNRTIIQLRTVPEDQKLLHQRNAALERWLSVGPCVTLLK